MWYKSGRDASIQWLGAHTGPTIKVFSVLVQSKISIRFRCSDELLVKAESNGKATSYNSPSLRNDKHSKFSVARFEFLVQNVYSKSWYLFTWSKQIHRHFVHI